MLRGWYRLMNIARREERWLAAIAEGEADVDWYEIDGLFWSSAVKLNGFRICMTYRRSLAAAALLGGRLPTYDEAVTMFRAADHIEPVILRPVSAEEVAIREHSRKVSALMGNRRLVDNEGKLWLAGAAPGRAVNFGWPSTAAPHLIAPGMRGWQPRGTAHNDLHVDYSQTLRVVRDTSPYDEEEDDPMWRNPDLSLGERAVEFSFAELRLGNLETQGTNAGPRIASYFAPAVRDGVGKLGLTRGNWCAVGACYAAQAALLPGETMPHPYRVSGIEMEQDAKVAGTWVPALDAMAPGAVKRGDVCILPRGGSGWERHVCRVLQIDGDQLRTVGANEGNSWRITERRTSDALGFVRYPRRALASDGLAHPDAMKRTQKAAHDAAKRRNQADGMDEVAALIEQLGEELVG